VDQDETAWDATSPSQGRSSVPIAYRFPFVVEEARFVARPNRFLVLAERGQGAGGSSGEIVKVHCPDPGRLRELLVPDARLYISPSQSIASTRRTQYDLRFVLHSAESGATVGERVLVSLDSRLPNRLIGLALESDAIRLGPGPQAVRAEVVGPLTHGQGIRSRFDFCVTGTDGMAWWVEVKSATLVKDGVALFPDAPTSRGRRHLEELAEIVRQGKARAAVIFVVQRPDAHALAAHGDRDPAFANALAGAYHAGVQICAITCTLTTEAITLNKVIPVRL
jgi:sugar fermentation stimulation protein A